jgi:hypothetical protein
MIAYRQSRSYEEALREATQATVYNPETHLYEPDDGTIRKPLPLTGWKPKGDAGVDNGVLILPGFKRTELLRLNGGPYPVEVLRDKGSIIGLRLCRFTHQCPECREVVHVGQSESLVTGRGWLHTDCVVALQRQQQRRTA